MAVMSPGILFQFLEATTIPDLSLAICDRVRERLGNRDSGMKLMTAFWNVRRAYKCLMLGSWPSKVGLCDFGDLVGHVGDALRDL